MPLLLRQRATNLTEHMDSEDCSLELIRATYQQFYTINNLLSQWRRIYKSHISPFLKANNGKATVLDIGFGGGDIAFLLHDLASEEGYILDITGIELDRRALDFVRSLDCPSNIIFRQALSSDLVNEGRTFDFVISNHLLHHLNSSEFDAVCKDAELLSTHKVIFNDIERSDIGYALFATFARLLFRNSLIVVDGLISIRRSYTHHELTDRAPINWRVQRLFPFRLLLTYSHHSA